MLSDLSVGDEIVTAGGLYGEVREVHDEEVLVRIAPELDVRVARRAVAGIVTPDEPEETGPTPGTEGGYPAPTCERPAEVPDLDGRDRRRSRRRAPDCDPRL